MLPPSVFMCGNMTFACVSLCCMCMYVRVCVSLCVHMCMLSVVWNGSILADDKKKKEDRTRSLVLKEIG